MKFDVALLTSLYVPVICFCLLAIWRYGKGLLSVVERGEFSMERHGVWLALVCVIAADVIENMYYGAGRISADFYAKLGWMVGAVIPMKLLILTGAVIACSAWCEVRYKSHVLISASLFAILLWAAAFFIIVEL